MLSQPDGMEAVILCGIQASGKTTFFREHFANTHTRISLDALRSRAREAMTLLECLQEKRSFVVDNTNPTAADRHRYVEPARAAGYRVICYYFDTTATRAIYRNNRRPVAERIPPGAIVATEQHLRPPQAEEGFDAIYRVSLKNTGGFAVEAL
jgi:predicted kinase